MYEAYNIFLKYLCRYHFYPFLISAAIALNLGTACDRHYTEILTIFIIDGAKNLMGEVEDRTKRRTICPNK